MTTAEAPLDTMPTSTRTTNETVIHGFDLYAGMHVSATSRAERAIPDTCAEEEFRILQVRLDEHENVHGWWVPVKDDGARGNAAPFTAHFTDRFIWHPGVRD